MSELFVLDLFPTRGFDQSIITPVLMGVWLLLLLTESFGWVFVGLVVPGYLASVFAISPSSGAAMMVEAVATLVIARGISRGLSRTEIWSPFFGRERFFLIVLVSVLVRQNTQLWIFPRAIAAWESTFDAPLDVELQFGSIGLVLVPLIANMFWKLRVRSGLLQVAVPTVIVWFALTQFLLPHTNLSLSSMELTYEGFAIDFLGSPKAYMVLLVTAYVAAQFNLWYGWDYNGILVPALLALVWLEPIEIATTIGIAIVLVFLVRGVLALPGIRTLNMEGPRKIVLTFTVAYALEFGIAYAIGDRFSEVKVTDLFGFGYILPSLIAVKIIQKKKILRITIPIVIVSFIGFVGGSAVGILFELVLPRPAEIVDDPPLGVRSERSVRSPAAVVDLARARTHAVASELSGDPRASARAVTSVPQWIHDGGTPPDTLVVSAAAAGWSLARVGAPEPLIRSTYALVEREERLTMQVGLPTLLVVPGALGPVLSVSEEALASFSSEFLVSLCAQSDCAAIVTASEPRPDPRFGAVLTILGRARPVLELVSDSSAAAGAPILHVRGKIGSEFQFGDPFPTPSLRWTVPPGRARARWNTGESTGLLRIHPTDTRLPATQAAGSDLSDDPLFGWLRSRIDLDPSGSSRPYSETELMSVEGLVIDLIERASGTEGLPPELFSLARRLDATLTTFGDPAASAASADNAWVLDGPDLGTIVVRRGTADPIAVVVPRPEQELGVARIALPAWRVARARALVIGPPTNVRPRADYDPNPTRPGNVVTPIQVIHQALHRALLTTEAPLIIHLRGLADERPVADDVLIAVDRPLLHGDHQIPVRVSDLQHGAWGTLLAGSGHVDGGASSVDLDGQRSPQFRFSSAVGGVDVTQIWLTEKRRRQLNASGAKSELRRANRTLTPFVNASASNLLIDPPLATASVDPEDAQMPELLRLAQSYARTRSMVTRATLIERGADPATRVVFGVLDAQQIPFIFLETRAGADIHRELVLLTTAGACEHESFEAGADIDAARTRIDEAVFRRCGRLSIRGRHPGGAP